MPRDALRGWTTLDWCVLDVGVSEGLAFVVEESLHGAHTLTSLLAQGGLPAEEVRRMVGETATALDAAGQRGLHHLMLPQPDPAHSGRLGECFAAWRSLRRSPALTTWSPMRRPGSTRLARWRWRMPVSRADGPWTPTRVVWSAPPGWWVACQPLRRSPRVCPAISTRCAG